MNNISKPAEPVYLDETERAEKMNFIAQQIKETIRQDADGVTVRLATITCRCTSKRGIMHMFQCLYCREWYCQQCAEAHFGKTVAEYRAEQRSQ